MADVASNTGTAAGVGSMIGGLPGALIGGGIGLVGSLFSNALNQSATDRQNEYNSPANQMARFRAAGLNPSLVYTQGNAGNQAQPVEFGVPDLDPYHHFDKMLMYREAARKARMDEQQIAGQAISNQNAERELSLKNWLLEQEQYKKDSHFYPDYFKNQLAIMEEQVRKSVAERGHVGVQNDAVKADIDLKKLVKSEKEYIQRLRERGIEKNDYFLLRMLFGTNWQNMDNIANDSRNVKK